MLLKIKHWFLSKRFSFSYAEGNLEKQFYLLTYLEYARYNLTLDCVKYNTILQQIQELIN